MSAPEPTAHADVVRIAARAFERDRYLAALLSPRDARADLVTLAAFLGEIGRIPAFVTEPMMGEMRLQFWRDALLAGEAASSGHPIGDGLRDVLARHAIPNALAIGIVDATSLPLSDEPPRDDLELKQHLLKTQAAGFAIAARILGCERDEAAERYVTEAGLAYGYARGAIEFAPHLAQGRTLAPADAIAARSTTLERLAGGHDREAAAALITGFTTAAERHRRAADILHGTVSRRTRLACLPFAMVPSYCARVARLGTDAARAAVDVMPLTRVLRLWRASLR